MMWSIRLFAVPGHPCSGLPTELSTGDVDRALECRTCLLA
ncbi:hypothetical protein UO65_0420 [Actinokineospora spheciospongiae]|uniref:Uncharacterized protein n=1 Tax=Actinokineospora spheciospongiae TaxID=909613 RepID=W7J5H7_9PSEU|nr:hypothetical protein UO65_0420 [Actinokineospora spheciospongiae]